MNLSRRALMKAMAASSGALIGQRLLPGALPVAHAAAEPAHLVFVYLPGGFNAALGGVAAPFVTGNKFGITSTNIVTVGSGLTTDKATMGSLPQFALDHWHAVGARHGVSSHTTPDNNQGGGERAVTRKGNTSYLTKLAAAMGGDASLKAVHLGDYPAYRTQPAAGAVSLQRVTDLGSAIKALGASAPDPGAPDRTIMADGLATAKLLSSAQLGQNPESLLSAAEAYDASMATLRKAPGKPVTIGEINTAYALKGATVVSGFASQLAGAELMIRAAGSNVISVFDGGFVGWDFHQVTSAGVSQNMIFSRNRLLGEGSYDDRMAPLRTFMTRMLNLPDRNVVVAITGDFVRVPNGDHGDGVMTAVFGKYVKQGLSFPCDAKATFNAKTPGMDAHWAAIAAALKVSGNPFGANPYAIV
jgi:hypothetical protein